MGLNGETVLQVRDLHVGYVPGRPYGYQRALRAYIDIRVEKLTRREIYETVNHEFVSEPLDFAISGHVAYGTHWVAGGAMAPEILRSVTRTMNGISIKDLRRLAKIADLCHLSSMQAGCAHQDDTLPADLPAHLTIPWRLDNVEPCPITGYRYGSSWLIQPVTEELVDCVRRLCKIEEEQG